MIFGIALLTLGSAVALVCAYLLLLTMCSSESRAPRVLGVTTRFAVVVPAHDEESGIADTIESLRALEYPADLFEIVVVADNCSDRTGDVVRGSGATVLVRDDPQRMGKGYALAHAFEHLEEAAVDAFVVVDADTVVTPNLLSAFDARLRRGARALQSDYTVRNPTATWRTLLLTVALGCFHRLRSAARERLGLSCGLRGNGMCFSTDLLRARPYGAFSIVEDLEYGVQLGEDGHRVAYVPEASVYGEMAASEAASRSQRRRWEGGRKYLRRRAWSLLRRAVRARDKVLLDLAIDLAIPPLSSLVAVLLAGGVGAACLVVARPGPLAACNVAVWGFAWASVAAYLGRGWQLSGSGARGLLSLAEAPGYLLWKVVLRCRRAGSAGWVRTAREPRSASSNS